MINFNAISHFSLHATDKNIGGCRDVLFDDESFVIRYLVADTNTWLPLSRKVVISPISVLRVDAENNMIDLSITADAIINSPSIDEHKPVSREYEETLFQYFGYGYYWIGPGAWGDFAHPGQLADAYRTQDADQLTSTNKAVNHLRSCLEVGDYDAVFSNQETMHVCDFIVDTSAWRIVLLLIKTRSWIPGAKIYAVEPKHIAQIDWSQHKITFTTDTQHITQDGEFEIDRLNEKGYVSSFIHSAT